MKSRLLRTKQDQVNGSMVAAKREILKGATTTGLFTLKLGGKKEGKEKKDDKKC